jgi:hypothetical protein
MNAVLFGLCLVSAAAPVPKDAKPPVSCVVSLDPKLDPLDKGALTATMTNNTPDPIEFYSQLPAGMLGFIDVEIQGPDNKRISQERYDAMISSPYATAQLVGKLEPNKQLKLELWMARYVGKPEELKPGKYRVRVKLVYGERMTTSEWLAWEVKAKN